MTIKQLNNGWFLKIILKIRQVKWYKGVIKWRQKQMWKNNNNNNNIITKTNIVV